jgi:hypothetical protein
LLRDPETTALLRARRLNLGERFHPRKDGMALLTMRVRGIDELTNWVLGFGPHVQVLRPAALRERVARDLRAASAARSPRRVEPLGRSGMWRSLPPALRHAAAVAERGPTV